MGSLYQRKGSPFYWMKFYDQGRPVRESTGATGEKAAQRILKQREGRVADGLPHLPRADRVRYDEAVADLRAHYTATGSRDVEEANYKLAHLDRFFAQRRLAAIGPADLTRYVAARQTEEASNGTINRELAVLGRMLRLAYENNKLARLPLVRKLKEAPARQGFFERHQYEAVRGRLAPDLQVACDIAYTFGWRVQSEVLSLERRHLDLGAGTLRLDPGMTKNGEGRVVYLTGDLKAALAGQHARVDALQKRLGRVIPALFPHQGGRGRRRGDRIKDFRKAWKAACEAAGVPGRLRHDFRRTAVRNMERNGVSRSTATKLTGHKTEAVYRRYAIVSDQDLREASLRLDGHNPGHIRSGALDAEALSR